MGEMEYQYLISSNVRRKLEAAQVDPTSSIPSIVFPGMIVAHPFGDADPANLQAGKSN